MLVTCKNVIEKNYLSRPYPKPLNRLNIPYLKFVGFKGFGRTFIKHSLNFACIGVSDQHRLNMFFNLFKSSREKKQERNCEKCSREET